MHPLSAPELLAVWDSGLGQAPVERTLALLAAAGEMDRESLANLPVGQRDGRLLILREWTFGTKVSVVTTCSGCGQQLELDFDVDQIRAGAPDDRERHLSLTRDDYDVRFRPPNSADLIAAARETESTRQRQVLLDRCLVEIERDGEPVSADRLPETVVEAVVDGMAQADPQADVQLAVSCSACGRSWRAVFDIGPFFWSEIDSWAVRIVREVHVLASAYGWSERDILALSPRRRQLYLELASQWPTS
jgi:base plate protein